MGLIDKIKQYWQNRKQKALPEGNDDSLTSRKFNFLSNVFIKQGSYNSQLTKTEIEIEDFLNNYYNKLKKWNFNPQFGNYKIAYSSLVSSNEYITQEQCDKNAYNEQVVIPKYRASDKYNVSEAPGFYHIKSKNYVMPEYSDMSRVYINCETENIADLADMILRVNENPNFYMKFTSNQANLQNPRNEKMVIYCNNNDVDYTMQLIKYCKDSRPELFQNSKMLPFLKSVDNIASIASQPITDVYRGLDGQTKTIPQSVNAYLAVMLEESYVQTVNEIARFDDNLNFMFDPNNYNNESLYMLNYPYITSNYRDYLLNSMKAKLEVLSQNNNIEIDGIYQYRSTSDFNRNYEQEERY